MDSRQTAPGVVFSCLILFFVDSAHRELILQSRKLILQLRKLILHFPLIFLFFLFRQPPVGVSAGSVSNPRC